MVKYPDWWVSNRGLVAFKLEGDFDLAPKLLDLAVL